MNIEWRDDFGRHESVVLQVSDQQRRGTPLATEAGQAKLSGEALAAVLEQFRPYLLTIAWQRLPASLRTKMGRSDIVQETLIKGYAGFGGFSGETQEELKSWLRKILENLIKSRVRGFKTQAQDVGREEVYSGQEGRRVGASPSQAVLDREEHERLLAALARLPERERQALLLRYRDGLPYQKIGERLGLSERGAEKLWMRAVKAIAREMGVKSTAFER